jgi:hypothetical protein
VSTRRHGRFRRAILRVAPFASFAGLSVLTAIDGIDPLAVLFGIGALVAGKRLLDRRGNERRELKRWRRANAAELGRVAREDRIAAPQIKRLAALQEGVKEGFELLPEEHELLLFEDLRAVVDEVEVSALLARRRSALRRHLAAVKRQAIIKRIQGLEEEVEKIGQVSTLRASFAAALESRRGELATYDEIPQAIGLINAQPEGIAEGIDRRGIAQRRGNPPPSFLGNKRLARQPRTLVLVKNDAFASCAHSGAPTTLKVSSSGGNVAVRTYPRNLKSLALLAVLILCLFAFTLVSIGEAQAEERLSQTAQRPTANGEAERPAILDGKGADQAALQRSLVETSLLETESIETTMADASPPGQSLSSPVGSAPPASKSEPTPQQYAVVIRNGEIVESDPDLVPAPQEAQPAPALRLSDRPSLGKQAEVEPNKPAPAPGSAAPEPYSGSSETEVPAASLSGYVPPPVPSLSEGEGVPAGSPAPYPFEEDPDGGIASPSPRALIESVEQQAPSAAERIAGPAPSRTADQTIPPPAQQDAQQALPVSSAVEAASSGAVQATLTQTLTTVTDAAASVLETLGSWTNYYSPSGDTTESPLEGTISELLAPQLPSPFEGSSVSSSHSGVSGQAGPWGGFIVLLGVLVSRLVLLLRDGLLCWAAWKQPKPSSALLLPLERPG